MDLGRTGAILRAIRVARNERIRDVAARSGLSRSVISRVERGAARESSVGVYERLASALDANADLTIRWRGADLDRLLNASHSAMHEHIANLFQTLPDWNAAPEVSFSIYGERGVIDWLAWHAPTRSLLIVEIKTALVDVQSLLGTLDRYVRLAPTVARERGWDPVSISLWLVFEDSARNRRAVARHRSLFSQVFSADGHAIRSWLRRPVGTVHGLSFLTRSRGTAVRSRRVRLRADRGQAAERARA
jgi:transcriptional regulator with XRE-family HTH domain